MTPRDHGPGPEPQEPRARHRPGKMNVFAVRAAELTEDRPVLAAATANKPATYMQSVLGRLLLMPGN